MARKKKIKDLVRVGVHCDGKHLCLLHTFKLDQSVKTYRLGALKLIPFCPFNHETEVAIEDVEYTYTFLTRYPEQFIGFVV